MKKLEKTPMMTRYIFKFAFRILVFIAFFILYLDHSKIVEKAMTEDIVLGITPLTVLWAIFMITMIRHLIPTNMRSMAARKVLEESYVEVEGYNELDLYHFVRDQNLRAWKVMLIWLSFNAIWGALYLFGILDQWDLLMLTVFYYLCDYICILIFCPFQTGIMKNKCCVNCRIYDWGHFMMFTPMLFIKNFYSWSLFFTALIVLINWEISYAKHPERFFAGTNKRIQCENCKDKTCQIKNGIKTSVIKATGKSAK